MFDKPLCPSRDKRTPAAFWSRALALRQVKAKARNEIVAETLHGDPLSPCPHTGAQRLEAGSGHVPGQNPRRRALGQTSRDAIGNLRIQYLAGREASRNTGETRCLLSEPTFSTAPRRSI